MIPFLENLCLPVLVVYLFWVSVIGTTIATTNTIAARVTPVAERIFRRVRLQKKRE